jgi:putative ABC transport system substrate-binding protein
MFIALSSTAEAQQPKKVPVVGVLSGRGVPMVTAPDPDTDAFRQTLRELGYIEKQNILLEYRYTEGRPGNVPSLVAELVQLRVDVLVLTAPSVIRAATQATKTIPIVIVTTQDPVANGLVDSLAPQAET